MPATSTRAFACAERISFLLGMVFEGDVPPDECAFITVHVARLVEDARSTPVG